MAYDVGAIRELISADAIARRVRELGAQISRDYEGEALLVVVLLRGSVIFASDLIRETGLDLHLDFMKVASYAGSESTGEVRILQDLDEPVRGRHVLVVEDIVDTGLTLSRVAALLRSREPASLNVCALLDKPGRRKTGVDVRYVGFEIPDEFVVGYGLDYDQRYRQLPFVGVITDAEA